MIKPARKVEEAIYLISAEELSRNLTRGGKSAFVSKKDYSKQVSKEYLLVSDSLAYSRVRMGKGRKMTMTEARKYGMLDASAKDFTGTVFLWPLELVEYFRKPLEVSKAFQKPPFIGPVEILSERIRVGKYLVEPHASYVIDGKKTLIISNIRFFEYLNQPVYLFTTRDGKQLNLGEIEIGDPKEITLDQFRKLRKKHLVTEEERKKWWKGERTLYKYPVRVIRKFEVPIEIEFPRGPQVWVTDWRVKMKRSHGEYTIHDLQSFYLRKPGVDVAGGIANWGKTHYDIDVPIMMGYCGTLWPSIRNAIVSAFGEKLRPILHIFPNLYFTPFTNYIELFDFKFQRCHEELKRTAPIYPIHEDGEQVTYLYELLKDLESQYIVEDLVLATKDFKFWIRAEDLPPDFIVPFEFRVMRQMPKDIWSQVKFEYSLEKPDNNIPIEEYIPVYDFVLERRNPPVLVEMAKVEPTAEKQANKAKQRDRITFFEFFWPLKSAVESLVAYRKAEYYNVDSMLNYLKKLAQKRKLKTEIPVSFIEKKYD